LLIYLSPPPLPPPPPIAPCVSFLGGGARAALLGPYRYQHPALPTKKDVEKNKKSRSDTVPPGVRGNCISAQDLLTWRSGGVTYGTLIKIKNLIRETS
jgi:hypothetical protein